MYQKGSQWAKDTMKHKGEGEQTKNSNNSNKKLRINASLKKHLWQFWWGANALHEVWLWQEEGNVGKGIVAVGVYDVVCAFLW